MEVTGEKNECAVLLPESPQNQPWNQILDPEAPRNSVGTLLSPLRAPVSFRKSGMMPSDNRMTTSADDLCDLEIDTDDLCGRHVNRHQTTRKLVAGAPHQEKMDAPKVYHDSVPNTEVLGDITSASLKTLQCTIRLTSAAQADYDQGNSSKIWRSQEISCDPLPEEKNSEKEAQYTCRVWTHQLNSYNCSEKAQEGRECPEPKIATQGTQEVDNKLLEELNALHLEARLKEQIIGWAQHQEVTYANKELSSFIQLWNTAENLPVNKLDALKIIQNLSQKNLLTNGMLSEIYCFLRKGLVEENSPYSGEFKSALKSPCELNDQTCGENQKEGKNSLCKESIPEIKNGEKEAFHQVCTEQHLGELSLEDGPPSRFPVENTFVFSTSVYPSTAGHTIGLSRAVENHHSTGSDLRAMVLSFMQNLVGVYFGRKEEPTFRAEPHSTGKEKELDSGTEKAEVEMKDRIDETEYPKNAKQEKMVFEAEEDSHDNKDLEVIEKSEFEQLEKESSFATNSKDVETITKTTSVVEEPHAVLKEIKDEVQKADSKMEERIRFPSLQRAQKEHGKKGERTKKEKQTVRRKKKSDSKMLKIKKKQQHFKIRGRESCVHSENSVTSNTVQSGLCDPEVLLASGKTLVKAASNHSHHDKHEVTSPLKKFVGKPKFPSEIITPHKADQTNKRKTRSEYRKKSSGKVWICHATPPCTTKAAVKGSLPGCMPSKTSEVLNQIKDDSGFSMWRRKRLNIQGATVTAKTASDRSKGGSGGNGQTSDSSGSHSQGGGGGAYGGARPKTRNGGSRGGDDRGGNDDGNRPPRKNVPDSLPLVPEDPMDPRKQSAVLRKDFKGRRKKQHGTISSEQLFHCLGQAGQGIQTLRQIREMKELDQCLMLCLHNTNCVISPTPDDLICCTCAILHSLLSHFTTSAHGSSCHICLQLVTLVHFHVQECLRGRKGEDEDEEYSSNICLKMRQAQLCTDDAVTSMPAKVWIKMRKYLSAALGPVLLVDISLQEEEIGQSDSNELTPGLSQPSDSAITDTIQGFDAATGTKPISESALTALPLSSADETAQNASASIRSSTTSAQQGSAEPVQGHAAIMPKSSAGSGLSRRASKGVVPQQTIFEEPVSSNPSLPLPSAAEAAGQDQPTPNLVTQISVSGTSRTVDTPEDGEDIMFYIRSFDERARQQRQQTRHQQVSRKFSDDPYATQKTYGEHGTVSMPDTRDRLIVVEQNLSLEMQPFGVPGIGEVVYGTRQQLLRVARNWRQERDECKTTGYCRYQHREEGVILHAFKKKLKILHTRYQKHQQWERLVHLGNGVTGKCHLCIDRTSNFKFCCKKMHILHYEDQELDIWSELTHNNIVRFYGAIRHGEKIYMFAEFIDGGSLAAMIKEQWLVGRRLSHWTALNYFRQLLEVLTYLQSMGILHEDIKADNLLLREGTTEIVLADFGVAQQIPRDHTPPNRHPTGSPAYWSPEKAAMEGHGFRSDLWAAACVLIHMLSGSPPWIKRYPDAAILNFIIWSKPAPIDDVPENVKDSVRELLKCCLVKDQAIRPMARQILGHQAFQLLDQSGSLFSIAQPAVANSGCSASSSTGSLQQANGAPSQLLQTSHQSQLVLQPAQPVPQPVSCQPMPASEQSQQTLNQVQQSQFFSSQLPPYMQEGAEGNSSYDVTNPPSAAPSGNIVIRPPIKVVEIPRQPCREVPGCVPAVSDEPRSLPAPLHSEDDSPRTLNHKARPVRKSAPATSAPFLVQENLTESAQQPPSNSSQRKMATVMPTPSSTDFEMTHGHERVSDSNTTSVATVGVVQSTNFMALASYEQQKEDSVHQHTPYLMPQRERSDSLQQDLRSFRNQQVANPGSQMNRTKRDLPLSTKSGENSLLHPEMWPDMPPSVLPYVDENIFCQTLISDTWQGDAGPSNQPLYKPSQVSYDTCQYAASTLNVPVPAIADSENMAEVSVEQTNSQSNLSSYGTALGGSDMTSAVFPVETPPRKKRDSSDSSLGFTTGSQSTSPVTRVSLIKSPGTGQLLTIPQPSTDFLSTLTTTCTAPSNKTPADAALGSSNTVTGQRQVACSGLYSEYQALYPESPALSLEDIHLPGNRCRVPEMLSMIPEGTEQESLSTSVQQGSSDESVEGSMWDYIQDQFSVPSGNEDQLMQSLQKQSETRPKLQLYDPRSLASGNSAGNETSAQQNRVPVPRFELLFLSDSSTLRSGRNTFSSVDADNLFQQGDGIKAGETGVDEPDQAFTREQKREDPQVPHREDVPVNTKSLTRINSDEDHISSGDMFGSGPQNNKDFQEAAQYRQAQQQQQDQQKPVIQETPESQKQIHPLATVQREPIMPSGNMSPIMAGRNPNLRLNVPSPMMSTPQSSSSHQQNQGEQIRMAQASNVPDTGSSTHSRPPVDESFFLNVSPLTSSPSFSNLARRSDSRTRFRTDSGSTGSAPKSSTYDQQEQEWAILQEETPDLNLFLADPDPNIASGSEQSSTHFSLLFDRPGDASSSDQEESEMLSLLQERISDVQPEGQKLVFKNQVGQDLFDMRVKGRRAWKDLATTFRVEINNKAGFQHFTLWFMNDTPVDFFTTYDPSITAVKVTEVLEEEPNISSLCWCDSHVVY